MLAPFAARGASALCSLRLPVYLCGLFTQFLTAVAGCGRFIGTISSDITYFPKVTRTENVLLKLHKIDLKKSAQNNMMKPAFVCHSPYDLSVTSWPENKEESLIWCQGATGEQLGGFPMLADSKLKKDDLPGGRILLTLTQPPL